MTPIKAVLFDLDDTLWPIMPVITIAETRMYDWLSTHAPAVAARHSVASLRARRSALMAAEPRYALDLTALRQAVLTEAFEACGEDCARVEHAMEVFIAARNNVTPFDDVLPVLDRLSGRFLLGSVSNGAADLEAIGMARHFRISIAASRFGRAKPDPAIFHAACDALGVEPAATAYVGDDPLLDVEGAQKAGLQGIWMNRADIAGHPAPPSLPPHVSPDAICTTFHEVEQWLIKRIVVAPDLYAR